MMPRTTPDYLELRPVRNPGAGIKARRSELMLSEASVAAMSEMTVDEYADLERNPTDAYMTVSLRQLDLVGRALDLPLIKLLQLLPCTQPLQHASLRLLRETRQISISDLSEEIGISEEWITRAERDPCTLRDWVLDPVLALAHSLNVAVSCILDLATGDTDR